MAIKTGLDENKRKDIANKLSQLLAGTFMLYLKTQYFHWNVTGSQFVSLHELFDKQYNELFLAVDVIAERIRALGVQAPGTFQQFSDLSAVKEHVNLPKAAEMIHILLLDHEILTRQAREFFPAADEAEDEATADLLTERIEAHEKVAWMLRSLLEN